VVETGTAGTSQDLYDEVGRRLSSRIPVANFVGAGLALASGTLTSAHIEGQRAGWQDIVLFIVFMCLAAPLGYRLASQTCIKSMQWLLADRKASREEQRRLVMVPLWLAVQTMVGWALAAVAWSLLSAAGDHSAGYIARVGMSILLGGLATSGLVYLLVEWTIRPIVARAFADNVPERMLTPGVRTKLIASWLIGADVFLLMIGLSFVGRPSSEPPSAVAIWFIIGAGLLAGTAVVYVATRSLATPLVELRRSVGRVQRGDLDVVLTVNDGGELGMLQAGFNQMVAGLKERALLQDLFGRHVGEDVARNAVAAGDIVLGGERREVAAVFVDVIGSTRLAQTQRPEDVLRLLNSFFTTIVRVVAEEGGWVNKFEGDGALCVFGAPMPESDSAARALRAARTLRRELLALSALTPELDAAIGVSAGTVVAGNIGAEERYEYTVIGPPVNEAARLTDEAKQRFGRVLASEEAVQRAGDEANSWKVAGELKLRGYDTSTLAYEPSDRATVRTGS
jgi:adenylate cyclase